MCDLLKQIVLRLEAGGVGSALPSRILSILSICCIVNIRHIAYFGVMAKETVYPVKKLVNLTEEQAARIADFRFERRIPSENEAIRQLIEMALDQVGRPDMRHPPKPE